MEVAEVVTLDEFIRRHSTDIAESNKVCQEKYEKRLTRELDKCILEQAKQKHLWKKAYKVVAHTLRVQNAFKASVESQNNDIAVNLLNGRATLEEPPEEERELWQTVQNVIAEYQGLFEEAFLLINAPKSDSERDARDIHLQDFYNVVVKGQETDKFPSMPCIATTYEDIVIAVQCFLRCLANNAKRATVVYNGHGKATGQLCLEGEDKSPDNSTLLCDIYQLWLDNKRKADKDGTSVFLPSNITVVFAQCYGFIHCQKPEQKQVIKVVSLATPKEPKTSYRYECGTHQDQTYIKSSVHVELSAYAYKRSMESLDDDSFSGSASLPSLTEFDSLGITPSSPRDNIPAWSSQTDTSDGSSANSCEVIENTKEMFIPSLFVSSALNMRNDAALHPGSRFLETTSVPSTKNIWRDSHRLSRSWKKKHRLQYSCKDALTNAMKVGLLSLQNEMPNIVASANLVPEHRKSKKTSVLKSGQHKNGSAISALAEQGLRLLGDVRK